MKYIKNNEIYNRGEILHVKLEVSNPNYYREVSNPSYPKDGLEPKYINEINEGEDEFIIQDMQIINPSHEYLIENGWEVYIEPEYIPTLEESIQNKIMDIEMYDNSSNVNLFYIGEMELWLDKVMRMDITDLINEKKENGDDLIILWFNGIKFEYNILLADAMIRAVKNYATECYNVTHQHIANVRLLTTVEEVNNYNYTMGYPEILRFGGKL